MKDVFKNVLFDVGKPVFNRRGGGSSGPTTPVVYAIPYGLFGISISETAIRLNWSANITGGQFRIYISTDGTSFSALAVTSNLTYDATGLTAEQRYYFYIVSYIGAGESTPSNTYTEIPGAWYLVSGIASTSVEGAYTARGATSLANSYVNIKSPGTKDMTVGVAPLLASKYGWIFDGATKYLITSVIGTGWSVVVKFSDGKDNADQCIFGVYQAAAKMVVIENRVNTSPPKVQYGSQGALAVAPNIIKGVLGFAGQTGYRNGVADAGSIPTGTATTLAPYLGAMRGVSIWFKGLVSHLAIYNTELTSGQMLALANRLNIYSGIAENYVNQKIGSLICWNMSTFGAGEVADGDISPDTFAPTGYDMGQWLDAHVSAKMKRATLLVKHHDGFMLWPSAQAAAGYDPYTIERTTWWANNGHPDIVGDFVTGCRARGILPCFYFSVWDKTHEIRTGTTVVTDTAGYVAMITAQLTELLTNYGDIGAIWFDGWIWKLGYTQITFATLYNVVKGLQPDCLVIDNRGSTSSIESSIYVCENPVIGNYIPAANIVAAEDADVIRVDNKWFYHPGLGVAAGDFDAAATIKAHMDQSVARNGSLILGLSPGTDGHLPAAMVSILTDLGALM